MMLWLPATRAMRANARFLPLCAAAGFVDYWKAAGVRPDFLGGRPLTV